MSDTFFALISDYRNGQLDNSLNNVFSIAANEGYILLPEKEYAKALVNSYSISDLLLPCKPIWKTIQQAHDAGQDIFPRWFSYDLDRKQFSYTESALAEAFIHCHKVTKAGDLFMVDGEQQTADTVKAMLYKSLAIIRPDPGKLIYGAFSALTATLTNEEPQSNIPEWVIGSEINETVFAKYLIEKTGWKKTGNIIRTDDNQIVAATTAYRTIADEIAPYCPTKTQLKLKSLYKTILLYLPDVSDSEKFEIISAWELSQKEILPPECAVNSLLPAGLTVFAASPKIGKSWMCLALTEAVAIGNKFMGFDTHAGSCLYMALEDTDYRVKQRLKKIGSEMPKSLMFVNSGAKRLDDGLLLQLESWITETPDAKLIVIDTLARVKPIRASGLDAYQQDSLTIAPLQKLALKHGVSILLVTHYSKADRFSADADPYDRITGSNGLFAVADAAWLIYGKRGEKELTFRITGRDAINNEFKITFDSDTCKWSLLGTSEALEEQKKIDEYKANPMAQTIKAIVKEQGRWEVTASDLIKETANRTHQLAGKDAREIGKELSKITNLLLADGIMCTQLPGGRKGRGYCFEPTDNSMFS